MPPGTSFDKVLIMKIKVTKASGKVEDLNTDKLRGSLIRSGANREQADSIIETILAEIPPHITTKKIYGLAKKYLRQINHASGLRYSLKKALFRLGPSGFPFEKYIGEVLKKLRLQHGDRDPDERQMRKT